MNDMYVKVSDLAEYCDTNSSYLHGKGQSVAQAALRRVKEFAIENAADVQPVKRGKWALKKNAILTSECSLCKRSVSMLEAKFYKFCPYCGARIDLKGSEKNG